MSYASLKLPNPFSLSCIIRTLPSCLRRSSRSRPEGLKRQSALALQHLIGEVLLLFFEIGGIWLLFFGYAIDEPIRAEVQRLRNVAKLHLKRRGDLFSAADARDGAVAGEHIAGLRVRPKAFGRTFKFFAGLEPFFEFFGLLTRQFGTFFLLEVGDDPIANLFQRSLVSGKNCFEPNTISSRDRCGSAGSIHRGAGRKMASFTSLEFPNSRMGSVALTGRVSPTVR